MSSPTRWWPWTVRCRCVGRPRNRRRWRRCGRTTGAKPGGPPGSVACPRGPLPSLAAVNPSTALARVVVDELVRAGVTEVVLAPGSRSAPLAFALHAEDAASRLRLHVRVDERTASFLALGLARSRGVAAVVTTSGTAVANLHPAVLEAHHAGVPVVVLS